MLIISSRKDFDNSDHINISGHLIRDINLKTEVINNDDISLSEIKNIIKDKKILILVHGYNNEQFEVLDAYQIIEEKLSLISAGIYDYIIGYSWPGGNEGLEWWSAKRKANAVARQFRFLLENIGEETSQLDLMSHSLGARVILKALKESKKVDLIKNYYCTAPAVDNESLEPNEEFFDSLVSCERLFIFHSSKDDVLKFAYSVAEGNAALGLYGPEDREYIARKAKKIYVINCKKKAKKHGSYKRLDSMYKYIREYQSKNPSSKFKNL